MDVIHSLTGTLKAELTSADLAGALTAIHHAGITVYHIDQKEDLTVVLTIRRREYAALRKLAERRGEKLELKQRQGIYWKFQNGLRRPVLWIGLCLLLFLVLYLPTRVLFIQVEGNDTIPTKLILEKASQCGIEFWASRREVRSEKMKNALLGAIPELQWAGINTSGCVATISVQERSEAEPVEEKTGVSSIIAARDGVITACTVTKGNPLCKVGQAVRAGQTLVSGYTDCGICIQATRADAEVYAQTQRRLMVKTVDSAGQRGEQVRVEKKYSLIIGKNKINFYNDSSILDGSCVKMYSENYWTLPGGFQLPVAIAEEAWIYYCLDETAVSEDDAQQTLSQFAGSYLTEQMVAGQILNGQQTVEQLEGCYILYGQFACQEMIGREQNEEILINDGESN